jgi:hypothetical protein
MALPQNLFLHSCLQILNIWPLYKVRASRVQAHGRLITISQFQVLNIAHVTTSSKFSKEGLVAVGLLKLATRAAAGRCLSPDKEVNPFNKSNSAACPYFPSLKVYK